MPIHIAITRRVRPGCEAEFEAALREFFQTSFGHGGVLGASMLTPPPGSESREFGILRTFRNEAERDAFVTAYLKGKRIPTRESNALLEKFGPAILATP